MKTQEIVKHLQKALVDFGRIPQGIVHLYIRRLRASDNSSETENLQRLLARYETGHVDVDEGVLCAEADRVLRKLRKPDFYTDFYGSAIEVEPSDKAAYPVFPLTK